MVDADRSPWDTYICSSDFPAGDDTLKKFWMFLHLNQQPACSPPF
jgi:hypothetical protein